MNPFHRPIEEKYRNISPIEILDPYNPKLLLIPTIIGSLCYLTSLSILQEVNEQDHMS